MSDHATLTRIDQRITTAVRARTTAIRAHAPNLTLALTSEIDRLLDARNEHTAGSVTRRHQQNPTPPR